MTFTKQQLIFIGVAVLIAIVFLVIVFAGGRKSAEAVTLSVWGVDDELAWDYSIYRYQKDHPNVRIEYTGFNEASYEKELINALAAGRGPDIFMINNRWTVKHADKITPMPVGKLSANDFKALFPQVAEHDFLTSEGQIYGLPLSVDTLALFYNRDIFDRKGVALPPASWEEFLNVVPKLRSVDRAGNLTLAPAAIGGSSQNIANAPDILELLMLQTGALSSEEYPSETVRSEEGQNALEFYTRFSHATSTAYAWDALLPQETEAFARGATAMIFGYHKDIEKVKAENPFLNFGVEPAPQADPNQPVNLANYWGLTIASSSKNADAAWDFVNFVATNGDTTAYYLNSTGRPPALRTLINDHLDDSRLGVFSRQALTARGFYQADDEAVRDIFDKAIRKGLAGNSAFEILDEMETELGQSEVKEQ